MHRVVFQSVRFGAPRTVGVSLTEEPASRAVDHRAVDVVDAGHVLEFHQAVRRENAVGGRMAEPVEPAAGNLETQQPLITEMNVFAGLGLDGRRARLGPAEIVEGQQVGIRRRRRLLEAAVRHLKDGVESFDELAEARRINLDDRAAAPLDRLVRQLEVDRLGLRQRSVDDLLDAAAVGHDGDRALHRSRPRRSPGPSLAVAARPPCGRGSARRPSGLRLALMRWFSWPRRGARNHAVSSTVTVTDCGLSR